MLGGLRSPSWSVEGRDWPNRAFSRFVSAGGLNWHVQEMGSGPKLLLLHGTGAATHSFRDLAPALSAHFHILAPDLPGHGFTEMPRRSGLSLPGMILHLDSLLTRTDFRPDIVAGHSAGAAILLSMAMEGRIAPKAIVALNGALLPIRGAALFSPLAKLAFLNPLAPRLFARRALDNEATRRLLEGTGSTLDARGIDLYARLFRSPGHIAATLGMMASWDISRLERGVGALDVPLVLAVASDDRSIPPGDAQAILRRARHGRVVSLGRGGHLAHETRPVETAELILRIAGEAGITPPGAAS